MKQTGELRYKVECMVCGRQFIVRDRSSPIPQHPPKGQDFKPGTPYLPCVGSETIGRYIDYIV